MFATKNFKTTQFCLKSLDKTLLINGYAAVYREADLDNDIIMPDAFSAVCKTKLLWQHDMKMPIGKCHYVGSDDYGLFIEAELTRTNFTKEIEIMLKNGLIDSFSVGMLIDETHYENNHRIITKARLLEVSLVTFPAQQRAVISMVS